MAWRKPSDIEAWNLSMKLEAEFSAVLARSPACEDRRFCDDARDAAASPARNIAEGFGRYGDTEFARFADIAYGSLLETQTNLHIAQSRGYVSETEAQSLLALCEETKATTLGLLRTLKRRIAARKTRTRSTK
jgi:four helix bundle protein